MIIYITFTYKTEGDLQIKTCLYRKQAYVKGLALFAYVVNNNSVRNTK